MASPKKKKTAQITLGGVLLVAIVIAAKLIFGIDVLELSEQFDSENQGTHVVSAKQQDRLNETRATTDESAIRLLIDNEISGEMVLLESAEIVKLLPDDTDEPRHQRLLLKLETGGTVLVAHNIDLAHRIPAEEGDSITVYGQYEWNDRGGVLHWTHHAPRNNREGGWIEFDGKRYQ
jgi:hypothetical protein